jgi:hypothetical protein
MLIYCGKINKRYCIYASCDILLSCEPNCEMAQPMFHHIDHGEKPWRQKENDPRHTGVVFITGLRKTGFSDTIARHLKNLGI